MEELNNLIEEKEIKLAKIDNELEGINNSNKK